MKWNISTKIVDKKIIQELDLFLYEDTISRTMRMICDTQEEQIKNALIDLGWTPPREAKE